MIRIRDEARRGGNRYMLAFFAPLVRLLRALDRGAEVEQWLDEAVAITVDGPHVPAELRARAELASLLADTGRAAEAEPHLDRLREILAGGEDWRGAAGKVTLAEGVVAGALGRRAEAEAHIAHGVQTFRRYSAPFEEADALIASGRMLRADGDGASALKQLDAAAVYDRLGVAPRWLEQIEPDRQRAQESSSSERSHRSD